MADYPGNSSLTLVGLLLVLWLLLLSPDNCDLQVRSLKLLKESIFEALTNVSTSSRKELVAWEETRVCDSK